MTASAPVTDPTRPATADDLRARGTDLLRGGRVDEGIVALREAADLDPRDPGVRNNLGVAFARSQRFPEAFAEFGEATRLDPGFADAWRNWAVAARESGDPAAAAAYHAKVAELVPDSPTPHLDQARALLDAGRPADAAALLRGVTASAPDAFEAHLLLGRASARGGAPGDAVAAYQRAIELRPQSPEAYTGLALVLQDAGKIDDAVLHLRRALKFDPDNPDAHNNLGVALAAQGKTADAADCYRASIRCAPRSAEAHNNLGNALRGLGDVDGSFRHLREALAIRPGYAEAHNNLGITHVHAGDHAAAVACYDEAVRLRPGYPEAHLNRSLALLALGRFAEGWAAYEWRWQGKGLRPRFPDRPQWAGEPLAGKRILLHTEQGVGDTFQFVRYGRPLKDRGAWVVLECPKPLLRLMSDCPVVDQLVPQGDPLPGFDFHCPLLGLPLGFGTDLGSIPCPVPYLAADPILVKKWAGRLADLPGFKVGIVWQGNPDHPGDRFRSVPLAAFAPLAAVPGVTLVSLQQGFGREQLDADPGFAVATLPGLDDRGVFVETAALLRSLDLVVAVDTSVVHLSGALGVRAWAAIAQPFDWRWLRAREDSPWYPSVRLFRQRTRGDWADVFRRVADALAGEVRRTPAPARPRAREDAEAAYRRGVGAFGAGNLADAERAFRAAVDLDPGLRAARHNLGVTLARAGRHAEAIPLFREHVREVPGSGDGHANLGLALLETGSPHEAEPHLARAVALSPAHADAHLNLGVARLRTDRPADAVECFRAAARLGANPAAAHLNLGNALRSLKRYDEAVAAYTEAGRLDPAIPGLRNNLALAFKGAGRLAEAARELRTAALSSPDDADLCNNLGITLADAGAEAEGEGWLVRAVELRPDRPDLRRNLGIVRLVRGDYERGWTDFDARWACPEARGGPPRPPRWDGTTLAGRTILLYAEQGLGDTIQFVRFADILLRQGGRVLLECPPPLVPLLRSCPGIDHFVRPGEPPPADVSCPLMSVAGLLGTRIDTIPATVPYVTPDPDRVARWRDRLRHVGGFRVGIAWQGSRSYGGDGWRSAPLAAFAPLAAVPGVQLVSLQKGPGTEQLGAAGFGLLDLGRQIDEDGDAFADTAAVVAGLDLVVAVDTAVVHLAGAMGVPVWVAVSGAVDWRWLRGRDDSPWYPTARVFRQDGVGDWAGVFDRMAAALAAVAGSTAAIPVGAGELLDRLTILELKADRITDPAKLAHVRAELGVAIAAWAGLRLGGRFDDLRDELRRVNERIWDAEAVIRHLDRAGETGAAFVAACRAVRADNDARAALKRRVNDLTGSRLVEEKDYPSRTGG